MTKQKFVEYVRSHKKEIAMGALGLVGTGLLAALGVKFSEAHKSVKDGNFTDDELKLLSGLDLLSEDA